MIITPCPADLKHLDFFSSLEEGELALLSQRAVLKRLSPGEALFHEGEPLDPALRFLYSGSLQVRRTSRSGKETILRLIRKGEMFGVAPLFDRKLAPGSALATEPTEVLEIRLEDLMTYLTHEPAIAMKLLVTFAQRIRELQDTLHAVVSGRARTRLARVILGTLDQGGATALKDDLRLKTKLPHATLSRMVGITYEECVRLMREWSHEPEVVRYERGGVIIVCDRRELERQASED
ncbi:MAG TPA: Crp/Fnr family transcriptional regulator [Pantanalinema sp.]